VSSVETPVLNESDPQSTFSKSIIISGFRCVLTYVLLPFVAPFLGFAPGIGPGVGLVIGVIALIANFFSIRRFWVADHKWKYHVTVLHIAVIGLLIALLYFDIKALI